MSLQEQILKESVMNLDRVFAVVGSALDSQRQRLNNVLEIWRMRNQPRTRRGPYVRRDVVFQTTAPGAFFLCLCPSVWGYLHGTRWRPNYGYC